MDSIDQMSEGHKSDLDLLGLASTPSLIRSQVVDRLEKSSNLPRGLWPQPSTICILRVAMKSTCCRATKGLLEVLYVALVTDDGQAVTTLKNGYSGT